MKPFTHHSRVAAGCGVKHPVQEPEYVEHRNVLFEDLPDSRSSRDHTSGNNKKSSSKNSKSIARSINVGRNSHTTAKTPPVATEDFANIADVGSSAGATLLTDATSPAAAAGDDAVGISLSASAPTMEKLQSTLLTLTARKLPSGPLPKMDEVIARFMNISPKQWQLLNTTIDELNGRFREGALHWLLLRWLVAAHPEQFFPPPFNSYQQLLQQISQKDAEVLEAKNNAAKWRDICARLEEERQTRKRQFQQMEKEVSGLYNALAERQELVFASEGRTKEQQLQQRSDTSGCSTAELPAVHKEAVKGQTQLQESYQLRQREQTQQRQQQQRQQQEQKCQQHPQDLQAHDDYQRAKQPAAMLLHQLVHPESSTEDACSCEPLLGVEVQPEEEKREPDPSKLCCPTTTTRTKTTVTTTKSSSTSSHSVCVTKESDPAGDSLTDATDQQLRDKPVQKNGRSLQAVVDVCEKERTGDEASLVNILGCVQNLLRRITAEGKDSSILSPSLSSLQAAEGSEISAFASPRRRELSKRHGKKVQRKNVELWYLQYHQQCSPSAAKDRNTVKRKQHLRQDKRESDKKDNDQEQHRHQVACGQLASKEEKEEEIKQLQDEAFNVEKNCVDCSAPFAAQSGSGPAAGRGADAQLVVPRTDGLEVEKQSIYLPPCSPCAQAKSPVPHLLGGGVETSHGPHMSATSETSPLPHALLQETQDNSPVKSYIRRFMALYQEGQHIPELVTIRIFTDNLKPALKQYVRSRHPTSLAHAILLARQGERYSADVPVPMSSERIRTGNSSAHDGCRVPSAATLDEGYAIKRGTDVDEEKVSGYGKEQVIDYAPRVAASCISSQSVAAGQHRHRNFLQKNEATTGTHSASQQWQVQLHETQHGQQLQTQQLSHVQQQQEQLLQDAELLEEEVWHSSEDTGHPAHGAFVMPVARRDLQQQRYDEEEQHQKVMVPQEKTVIITRPGSKQDSTKGTHIVGKVKRQQPKYTAT